jgi:PAS domain S-box-containing protein
MKEESLGSAMDPEVNRVTAARSSGVVEDSFRLLVEEVKDCAVFLLEPAGRVLSWNAGADRLLGYRADEILGQHISRFYTPEDIQQDKPGRALEEAATRGSAEAEGWRARRDGSRFWASTLLTALRDEAGGLRGFGLVIRDVTERRRAEAELQRTAEELLRSNGERERFAYLASHDLQEPLRVMASFTQLLAQEYRDKLDAEAREYIGYVIDGAKRMQSLINQLVEFSRLNVDRRSFVLLDCRKLYETAVANLKSAIEESGAALTSGPLPSVPGDSVRLGQVFQHLLSNAIKFRSARPPEVQVRAEPKDGHWQFAVRDNGIGIEPKQFDRLFVIFQRLHRREEYPGTGFGLAACKKIVELHGGRVWVESEPDRGSTFYFTIPGASGS